LKNNPFVIDDPRVCYLDGNSLGRLPVAAANRVDHVVQDGWGKQLIAGWNNDWIDLPNRLGAKIARIIGCHDDETVVADSTSVNLYKLATAALRIQADRSIVLTDSANFPSDLYILESAIASAGSLQSVRRIGAMEQLVISTDQIIEAIDGDTALVCLSHVAYKSGQLYDLAAITAAAHRAGALVLWDLSHSVGAVPIDLNAANVDLAVGCTYKYLCGGPGSPAFLYCRRDLIPKLSNPIAGWFSHQNPFQFDVNYDPSSDINRFLTGTPPILSLAAIEAGLDLVLDVGIESLRETSIQLTSRLIDAFESRLRPLGFDMRTPTNPAQRGSHVSLGHTEARRITANLIERHSVIPDFRSPDNLRLGIAPLYTTESEIDRALDAIETTVTQREFESVQLPQAPVT
jgi:kynureninase